MKNLAHNYSPKFLWNMYRYLKYNIFDGYSLRSYSQEGEDMILNRLFEKKNNGFYVDVGAHHPKRFSNTYFFYKKGWRGINIDAMPGSMKLFNKIRPRDINLEVAISDRKDFLNYFIYKETALNTFSEKLTTERSKTHEDRVISTKKIQTEKLSDILNKYVSQNQTIDFISVDVEGHDLKVLQSNNWHKFKPLFLLVEITNNNLDEIYETEIYIFLSEIGYKVFAKTINTIILKYEGVSHYKK